MRLSLGLASICFCGCLGLAAQALAQTPPSRLVHKDPIMTRHAEGTFDVKTTPIAADNETMGTLIGRYSLDKQFHGDLDATSKGEMLAAGEPSSGNAGYVAMEQVTGTLDGRAGSFALQHIGSMENGSYKLSVVVVPGSGTGQLAGIAGTLTIIVAAGKHSYTFDYTLPAPAQ
ncbi:MAG TPA: DUF3224 domain-containing protein [Terracidiphilus sp.]